MKTVEIMYFPLVLSVLKWSGEEKLGSVHPSRFFCTSVTVYNMVYFNNNYLLLKIMLFSVLSGALAPPKCDDRMLHGPKSDGISRKAVWYHLFHFSAYVRHSPF